MKRGPCLLLLLGGGVSVVGLGRVGLRMGLLITTLGGRLDERNLLMEIWLILLYY